MKRSILWTGLALFVFAGGAFAYPDGKPIGQDAWKYDVVYLKNGESFVGLVLEENAKHVLMRLVSRRPGAPTIVNKENFARREVRKIELLGPEDRAVLSKRLDDLAEERKKFLARLDKLEPGNPGVVGEDPVAFKPAKWVDGESPALEYRSTYFTLRTNTKEDIARLAVLLLEQIYISYTRSLPPRVKAGKPTLILLTGTLEDYHKLLFERNIRLTNPAFYDSSKNQIVCGSDLQRLREDLERIRTQHRKLYAEFEQRKKQLRALYKGNIPPPLREPILQAQKRIRTQDRANGETFEKARDRLFQRLYHEAFHAYLDNFVYPEAEGAVPRWLNEGLAQIFELAIVEVGELRVGHASKQRVVDVRNAIATDDLIPVADIVRSDAQQFLAFHDGKKTTPEDKEKTSEEEKRTSDRYYLSSWALASYLAFDQKLLGSPKMDEYVKALKRGVDPVIAFRDFAGKKISEVEAEYVKYLQQLEAP